MYTLSWYERSADFVYVDPDGNHEGSQLDDAEHDHDTDESGDDPGTGHFVMPTSRPNQMLLPYEEGLDEAPLDEAMSDIEEGK